VGRLTLRRMAGVGASAMVLAGVLMLIVGPATATHVSPIPIPGSGNATCGDFDGWSEFKVDPPANGTYTGGDGSVTISGFDGVTFDWSSTFGIDAVFVKSGVDSSQLYVYNPEATSDSGLTTQDGKEISHISFCWDDDEVTTTTEPPTTTTEPPTTTTEPPTTTTEPPTTTTEPPTTTTTEPPTTTVPATVLPTVLTTSTTVASTETLPFTGGPGEGLAVPGVALLLGGAALLWATRRRSKPGLD